MTVSDLIKQLTNLCEGRDPSIVEIKKVIPAEPGNMWVMIGKIFILIQLVVMNTPLWC